MRRLSFVAAAALMLASSSTAAADIGIVQVRPTQARQGDRIRVGAAGYLGMTHQTFTVVLIPAVLAPRPYSCMHGTAICTPAFLPAALGRPPFTIVGKINHWRQVGPRGIHQGRALLTFRLPRVAPGLYVLGLFCPTCTRGPRGSLIVAERLILRVRR